MTHTSLSPSCNLSLCAMAKGTAAGSQRLSVARATFLYQAAHFMLDLPDKKSSAEQQETSKPSSDSDTMPGHTVSSNVKPHYTCPKVDHFDHHLLFQLRDVCQKTQVRLPRDIKNTICRRCKGILKPGETVMGEIYNPSRKARYLKQKLMVVECTRCGCVKRYPIGANRQQPKRLRQTETSDQNASKRPKLRKGARFRKSIFSKVEGA